MRTARLALFAALIATLIWGATPPIAKFTFQQMPPFVTAFVRFAFAAIIFFPILGFQDKLRNIKTKDYPLLTLLSFLGITLSIGLFFIGLSMSSAIDAGIIISTGPLFNAIAAKIFLKEKVGRIHLFGALLATFGTLVIIIVQPLFEGKLGTNINILGNILLLLSVLASTAFNIISKESLQRFDASTIVGYSFLIGAFSFLPLALWQNAQNPTWTGNLDLQGIFGLGFLVLFSSIAAYLLYEWALEKLPVSKILAMTFIQPVVTVLVAILILGEKINTPFIVGAGLILAGMFLATKSAPHHHHRHSGQRV